MIKLEEGATS